jgi:hypothetical protein
MYKSSRVKVADVYSRFAKDAEVAKWLEENADELLANDDTGVSVFEVKNDTAFSLYADQSESDNIWDEWEYSCASGWSATHTPEDNARAAANKRNSRARLAAAETEEQREARKEKARAYAKAYREAKKNTGE